MFKNINDRLDRRLAKYDSISTSQFTSKNDFINYLSEGAVLNINKMCSEIFMVPYGKYMVWELSPTNASLVPLNEKPNEILSKDYKAYDVLTKTLVNNWNNIVTESEEDEKHDEDGGFKSKIDMSSVDRIPLARALQDAGMSVTELANACGVDAPAISRILRKPRDTSGDPGGRNPSMELASKICAVLRIDPRAAFPDFFRIDASHKARKPPANRGSGAGNKGKATETWTQGNAQ